MGRSVSRINPWAAAFLAGAALALGVSGCATGQERKQSKEWSTLRLAEGLAERGHEVHVLTPDLGKERVDEPRGVRVRREAEKSV